MENNTDTQVVDNVVQEETTKTYTKEDLDNSFNAGVKKASTEWQKDEKYKEFLAWKKTSQSDSEKMAELQTNYTNAMNENTLLKAQLKIADSDVKKEFAKFVTSEVMGLVNDTTDFDAALKEFKKSSPQYFGETVVKKVQSSPSLNAGGNQPQTMNQVMNDFIRNR